MLAQLRPALVVTAFFTLLLGVAYPLAVTGIAQVAMPFQANGSILKVGGKPVGSALLAQSFTGAGYLHPRPSAAGSDGYDASASSGSNLGPMNEDLAKRVAESTAVLKTGGISDVPADAVTTSGSGLDPHISPAYADAQTPRIAAARRLPLAEVTRIIETNTSKPSLGFLGQPAVNVLKTNLALDTATAKAQAPTP